MNRRNVDFGTVLERSTCLNAKPESMNVDSAKRFKLLNTQLESCKKKQQLDHNTLSSLHSYIESLANPVNANQYYTQPLYLVQELNNIDSKVADQVLREYVNRVLPYVKSLGYISESIERYDLSKVQRESVLNKAADFVSVDRILANHNQISERFNILQEVERTKGLGLRETVNRCCSMIDTYTIPPYAKMNLCLEEMMYLFHRAGVPYTNQELLEYTTNYFLLRDANISDYDMNGYRYVLKENKVVTNDDLPAVSHVLAPDKVKATNIQSAVYRFLIQQNKSLSSLEELIGGIIRNTTMLDIICNTERIIWVLWEVYRSSIFVEKNTREEISILLDLIIDKISNNLGYININGEERPIFGLDLDKIMEKVKGVKNIIKIVGDEDYDTIIKKSSFNGILDEFIKKLETLRQIVYSNKASAEAIGYVNQDSNCKAVPLKEFKVFKFHNLTKACTNLDKYLKVKTKSLLKKAKNKTKLAIKKVKDVLFEDTTDIYSYIGEDAKADICTTQILYDDSVLEDVKEFLENTCKDMNSQLLCENMSSIRCYYIMNPGVAEIHLKESTPILLDEEEWKLVRESYNNTFDVYIDLFAETAVCMETLDQLSEEHELSIESALKDILNCENLTVEAYETTLEALSLLNVTEEQVKFFTECYNDARYSTAVLESVITESEFKEENKKKEKAEINWSATSQVPLDIQIEAYQCLLVISEAIKKPEVKKPTVGTVKTTKNTNTTEKKPKDDPNTKVDESRKNPFKGINLNSIRLYLQGLKTKAKDMNTKQKEISRNLDNGFRRFVKAMKDALISDRREAIIKGSVIPSFSKCIKIAIGLAGTGLITGNPVVPLLAAIGGFAVSKRLTKKERILLLDEIETELDVVDKEISMAESRNQLKKYRVLLKYKKDLQRQYQRIRYNVRVGKDILPGSTTGLPNND